LKNSIETLEKIGLNSLHLYYGHNEK